MKDLLIKLAEVATKLDEAGHSEQAAQIDFVLNQLQTEFKTLAGAPPLAGIQSLNPDEQTEIQNQSPVSSLPPSVAGKVVIKGKTKDATGYGFFGADQVQLAVKEGKIDEAEAIRAMQNYLKLMGSSIIGQTLPELLSSAIARSLLDVNGHKEPEVYGHKNLWQKILGQ